MEVIKGFVTLYQDKKKDRLLAQIPKGMIRKNFLMGTSIAGGSPMTGWQWADGVFYFERQNKKLILMEVDPRYSKGADAPVVDVIKRTYTDRIVRAIPIETEAAGGDPVIGLDALLKSDLTQTAGGAVDAGLSRYTEIKAFPENIELTVDLAVMGGPGGTYQRIHYSISNLRDSEYKPREADERVGYFLTVQKDWTVPHEARTVFKRFINRWYLKKSDPAQEVGDVTADTQIVFYIEKTVPVKYRRFVREGILEWNKAFEKAGLRNAVQVRQQTENTFADLDPADCRYNFFRWIVSGVPYAMGPSRANPFSGQIYDADIVFDDAMLRSMEATYRLNQPRAAAWFTDARLNDFLACHPDWRPGEPALPDAWTTATPPPAELLARLAGQCGQPGGHSCELGRGLVHQLQMAGLMARAEGLENLPEEFIGAALRETVMHEVGHTLGLRHNFKASSWKSLAEIKASRGSDEPTTGSVMDYNPYSFSSAKADQGCFASPTLGPYDYWAIEYGYRQPAGEIKNDKDLLKAITDRVAESGLDYATDEDASFLDPDPRTLRWDNGRDPLDFARDRAATFNRLLANAADWAVEDGESYTRLREALQVMLNDYAYGMFAAARVVGGQYLHRDRKGDPNARPPAVLVPAAEQRSALQFLGETILAPGAFNFSPELLNRLAAGRWLHWDSDDFDGTAAFPIHDYVLDIQGTVVFILLNPFTVERVYDAQLKVSAGDEALTVPELFNTVGGLVWAELADKPAAAGPAGRPRIDSFRRGLQRAHLDVLIRAVVAPAGMGYPEDVVGVVRDHLARLGERIDACLSAAGPSLDAYTRAHLQDARVRITRALDAGYVTGLSTR